MDPFAAPATHSDVATLHLRDVVAPTPEEDSIPLAGRTIINVPLGRFRAVMAVTATNLANLPMQVMDENGDPVTIHRADGSETNSFDIRVSAVDSPGNSVFIFTGGRGTGLHILDGDPGKAHVFDRRVSFLRVDATGATSGELRYTVL